MKCFRLLPHVILIYLVLSGGSNGWSDDSEYPLDPIVISASRSDTPSSRVADQTQVITAKDLQGLPVHNLAEALNYVPGVDIQNNGPFGQATSVSIRGSASRQVLVMVDGIPFNTQLSGQANLSRIPIENIEQIDVIKGGDSSAWGSSLGGVINVITKPPGTTAKPQGHLTTSYGSFASTKNSLDLQGKVGKFGYSAFGSFLHAKGNLADSSTQEIKNFTKVKYDFNETTNLTTSFGYSGAQLWYGPTSSRISNQPYLSRYGQMALNTDQEDNQFTAAYKYNDQDNSSTSYDATTRVAQPLSVINHDFYQGISLNDVYEINSNQILTAGADFDWHILKSTLYLSEAKTLTTQAPYANLTWRIKDFDLIPGIRFDHNSHFGSQLSPSLGAVYHVPAWNNGVMRAKASRVFTTPPLLWVFNNDPSLFVLPNPDLKAERGNLYEIGVEGPLFSDQIKGTFNLYRSDVSDAVAYDAVSFQERNFKKFIRQGGEARIDYEVLKQWRLYAAAGFNDVRDGTTKQIVRGQGVARQSFKWGSSYAFPGGLTMYLDGYYSRWDSTPTRANDRKPIFDTRLTEDLPNLFHEVDLEIFLNVYNLTNSQYWFSPTYPLPGRYLEGGITASF